LSLEPQTPPPTLDQDEQARRAFEQPPKASQPAPLPPRSSTRSRTTTPEMAEILLKQLSSVPDGVTLPGEPVSLADVVRDASTRRAQTDRISAYWDLSYAVADFYLAAREATEIDSIVRQAGITMASFEAEELALKTRLAATQQAVVLAQARLKRLLGSYESPIPADLPLCDSYETNYDRIFAESVSEAAPSFDTARSLDQLIPLRYQQVLSDAATVERGYQELAAAGNQAVSVDAPLSAHRTFSLARRAFLKTVYDYNHDIAEYSQLARPQRLTASRLVAMHIGTAEEVFSGADSNVLPATAIEPIQPGRRESRRPIVEEAEEAPEQEDVEEAEETAEDELPEHEEASTEATAEEATPAESESASDIEDANDVAKSTEADEAEVEDSPTEEADANDSEEQDKKITAEELFGPE
ncbi:MAG: hypothetical protein RID07_00655, partial [Lacipirellulaceae bacterium]